MIAKLTGVIIKLLLVAAALIVVYPVFYAFSSSLMTQPEIDAFPPHLLPSGLYMDNYKSVFAMVPVARYMLNSFFVSFSITGGHLLMGGLAAYAFAFIRFPGKSFVFSIFLATMMIPWEVTVIPNFLTIRGWGWTDSYLGLIVPFLVTGFGTFLLRQFFLQLPREVLEAAKIDGYGHVRTFVHIVLPLARTAFATLAIHSFINAWEMYLWPLLITNEKLMRTVQIGVTMLKSEDFTAWNLVMAGVTLMMLPPLIVLLFGINKLVSNLTLGSLKG